MFSFEKEMSVQLLKAARKRLPDFLKLPDRPLSEYDWRDLLRKITLGMVRRGEFDIAVRHLSAILIEIAVTGNVDYNKLSPQFFNSTVESMIIVLEVLNAALSEQLVLLELVSSEEMDTYDTLPLKCITKWSSLEGVPPLERHVAENILTFARLVMPKGLTETPVSTPAALNSVCALENLTMSLCQYIFTSNSSIILDRIQEVLYDRHQIARKELLGLSCPNADTYGDYMHSVRNALPKLSSKQQVELMNLICGSLGRNILAHPTLAFADSPLARNSSQSFIHWIEKLSAFKPLRIMRCQEAVISSILELIEMGLELESSDKKSTKLLSLAGTKTFERSKSILKRENTTDKRVANRIAAAQYMSIIGFLSWATSQKPNGGAFYGVVTEITPFISEIFENFDQMDQNCQVVFMCFCGAVNDPIYLKNLRELDSDVVFEAVRLFQVFLPPAHFSQILEESCDHYVQCFSKLLSHRTRLDARIVLDMLLHIPSEHIPFKVTERILVVLCRYISSKETYQMPKVSRLFEEYIYKIYNSLRSANYNPVDLLEPLLPVGEPYENYYKAYKIHNLHLYLKLIASGYEVIPEKNLNGRLLDEAGLKKLHVLLLLCICVEESMEVSDIGLNCLFLLQSEPYQSAAQRDLISELLDSMEHSSPSTHLMHVRMTICLARSTDKSFIPFNRAIREALEHIHNTPLTIHTHQALIRMRAATLAVESIKDQQEFINGMFSYSTSLLQILEFNEPVMSSRRAIEVFDLIESNIMTIFEHDNPDSISKGFLLTATIKILQQITGCEDIDLRLSKICVLFFRKLKDPTLYEETVVLKLAAVFASYLYSHNGKCHYINEVIQLIISRTWLESSDALVKSTLITIFEHYKVSDGTDLLNLSVQLIKFESEGSKIAPILTALLRANIDKSVLLSQNALALYPICRACVYDVLSHELSYKVNMNNSLFDKTELVLFFLNHVPILETFCDVCSVVGNDTLCSALLELFGSYSQISERQLITVSLQHELKRTSNSSELLRSNSVTVKIILEWMRLRSGDYLQGVLSPILGSLRSASLRNNFDVDDIFGDALIRFESHTIPDNIQWFLQLLKEVVTEKFGEEMAETTISNLLCVRYICPAILAPHKYNLTSRAPTRDFAKTLRKYVIYLQSKKKELKEAILKSKSPLYAMNSMSSSEFANALSEIDVDHLQIESMDQYTSATRNVFHLLRRHSVEIRLVLLSRGYGELAFSMMRYLRLGKSITFENDESEDVAQIDLKGSFKGEDVLIVNAMTLCNDTTISSSVGNCVLKYNIPILVDFTANTGHTDLWSESMSQVAYKILQKPSNKLRVIAFNCPQSAFIALKKLSAILGLVIETEMVNSLEFKDDIESIPQSLTNARMATSDITTAVAFDVNVENKLDTRATEATLFVGEQFFQLKIMDSYEVIPYIPPAEALCKLMVIFRRDEIVISCGSLTFKLYDPSPALERMIKFSLDASKAVLHGAIIETSCRDVMKTSCNFLFERVTSNNPLNIGNSTNEENDYLTTDLLSREISPGKILFSTLLDILNPSEVVRSRAIELYATLHDILKLKLNIPAPRETLKPNQVYSLADSAASCLPELSLTVTYHLAEMGVGISEEAARIASPWVAQLIFSNPAEKESFRQGVVKPLLEATKESPKIIGPILLEHFWPLLHDMPDICAEILLNCMKGASPGTLDAICQIAANGTSPNRPHEAQKLAQITLTRLYRLLRSNEVINQTKFQQHPHWEDLYNCILLFGSIAVDFLTAEIFFPDMGFILFIFSRIDDLRLRKTIYEMFVNYLNAFLQSPNVTGIQFQRLRSARSELSTSRSLHAFGIKETSCGEESGGISSLSPNSVDENYAFSSLERDDKNFKNMYSHAQTSSDDEWLYFTPDMSEFIGRLLWEAVVGVFGANLTKYQQARTGIATRVLEFVEVQWPPLQKRCILSLIGIVKFYMPEHVVVKLLSILGSCLSHEDPEVLHIQSELVNVLLCMFSETIECFSDSGNFQQHLFWFAIVAIATGCRTIQTCAVRLLKDSVKVEHFRGAFQEQSLASVFLKARPIWLPNIETLLVLPIPSNEMNFHAILVQLLVVPLQQRESEKAVLECFEVFSTACPDSILYPIFIFLCGNNQFLLPRVPSGSIMDTSDTVLNWIASKINTEHNFAIISLVYAAHICAHMESPNFLSISQKALSLVEKIKCRKIVYLVAPLFRTTLIRLLKLEDDTIDVKLIEWSLAIFSLTSEERSIINKDYHILNEIIGSFDLKPCFDKNFELIPLNTYNSFTAEAKKALGDKKWTTTHLIDESNWKYDGDQVF